MTNGSTVAIAAIVARKRREMLNAFRVADAISPSTAKLLPEIGVKERGLFRIQLSHRVIVRTSDNRYYLDEAREKEVDLIRKRFAFVMLALVTIILLVLILNR